MAPHVPQNRPPGRISAPHAGQSVGKAAPHSSQNRTPSRFCEPHREQFIDHLRRPGRAGRREKRRLWTEIVAATDDHRKAANVLEPRDRGAGSLGPSKQTSATADVLVGPGGEGRHSGSTGSSAKIRFDS
jgi:hypothetical protein